MLYHLLQCCVIQCCGVLCVAVGSGVDAGVSSGVRVCSDEVNVPPLLTVFEIVCTSRAVCSCSVVGGSHGGVIMLYASVVLIFVCFLSE